MEKEEIRNMFIDGKVTRQDLLNFIEKNMEIGFREILEFIDENGMIKELLEEVKG